MKSWKLGLTILVLIALALVVAPTTAIAQTFDNSGGGSWSEYMSFPITTTPTEYAQYKIVINGTTWELYNATGALEASGTSDNFWSLVSSTGADIRVFNQTGQQLYFWIEYFNATERKAIIWVKLTTGSTELNIAYRNPSALPSSYNNPKEVGLFFTDFEKPVTIKAYLSEGSSFDRPSNTSIKITGNKIGFHIFNGSEVVEFTEGIVEFRAKLYSGGSAVGSIGFIKRNGGIPWACFDNDASGNKIYANTRYSTDTSPEKTDLGDQYLDEWHVFKIKRNSTGTYYYIDGNLVATHHAGNDAIPIGAFTWGSQNIEIDWIKVYDLNGNLLYEFDFNDDEFMAIGAVEVNVSNSVATIHATSTSTWGVYVSCGKVFKTGMVARAKVYHASFTNPANENSKSACDGVINQYEDDDKWHISIYSKGQNQNIFKYCCGDGSNVNYGTFSNKYFNQWVIQEIIRYEDNSKVVFKINGESLEETSVIPTQDMFVKLHSCSSISDVKTDWIAIFSTNDPADFGAPVVKTFQKKFGTKTVYVNVTYLDTAVTERYNPTTYYKLEDKPQINVTSMISVSGVNATYGANISIELIDFVTLDKVVYNGTEVSVTYQGTITNATTGYVYNIYNFTTYESGTLEIYGHIGNKAYEATFKLDGETVDVFNVTAVIGEALEITLPHRGNVTLASIEYTGITSVFINTKDLETGVKTLTITIDDPENFTVGYRYGTVSIDWGKVHFNITDLQNKTLARTTYGFFNKNFGILSTDPTKLYAGDIKIDVYFHGVKLKSLEIYLNHSNNNLTLNVSVNATQFKDYRNVTRMIASPNYFEVVNLSTKYPFSVMKLVNVSGTIVIDYVSNAPTSVKVEGATSYTYEKPVLKITASGNVTVTDLYRLSIPLKDRLGNPVNFYVLINGSRVDASAGKASKLLKPSWYEVEVPITVAGFELWKFNDSSNIVLVEINTSDKTLPTAEYRVPSKIETKEARIQKTKFPWLPFPFPFLSKNEPAQEETPIVRLEGTLRDFYNAPVPNRTIKIEVASPNFTRIYNVTTDESGNFKIDVDMARGVEYKVTYKFAGDDVYVGTSTTKTFTIEQLLPAPPEEMTITEVLIFVGIAIGLVAVVAGAIYLAKRTKAKTLARMESEFRFFRRLK